METFTFLYRNNLKYKSEKKVLENIPVSISLCRMYAFCTFKEKGDQNLEEF